MWSNEKKLQILSQRAFSLNAGGNQFKESSRFLDFIRNERENMLKLEKNGNFVIQTEETAMHKRQWKP